MESSTALDIAAHEVDDLGRGLDAAQRGLADLVAAGQHLEQHSLRSFSAVGWMPSSVAMRSSTSPRWRSVSCISTAAAWS
jgi:hypothetical protein